MSSGGTAQVTPKTHQCFTTPKSFGASSRLDQAAGKCSWAGGKGLSGSVGVGTMQGARREHVAPHGQHVGYVDIMQHLAQICQAPAAAGQGLEEEGKGVARWESKEVPVTSSSSAAAMTHRVGGKERER